MRNHCVKKFSEKLDNLNISDYHGLSSPGMTCYLNSVLQVLFMTEDFREAVKGCDRKHSTTLDPYLGELFIHLERQEAKTNDVIEKLGITNVFRQRDAAEYFEKILCLTSPEASMVFKGELNHKTTCHGCNNKNDSKNFFWVLPLAVEDSNNKAFNVQRGLERFFEVQMVHGDNQMYCNSCNKKQNADTGCEMIQSPDVLTLLLKRFAFDYKKNCYVKLKCKADVAQTLHIQKCRYDLYAVVHHFGDLSGGHYTADIKSFETGQWYCFNDHIVKRVKSQHFEVEDNFLRSHTAYLLMYRKVSGQSKKTDSSDLESHSAHSGFLDKERRAVAAVESYRGGNDKHLNGDGKALWRKQTSSLRECDKQFDQSKARGRQRGNILPSAVIEPNAQQYGTKERVYHPYTGGITETTRPEWMLEGHHNDEIKRTRLYRTFEKQDGVIPKSGKNTYPSDHSPTKSKAKTAQPTVVNSHWKHEAGVGIQVKNIKPRREACVSDVLNSHVKLQQIHSRTPSLQSRSRSLCRGNESSKCNGSPHLRRKSSSLNRTGEQTHVSANGSLKKKALQTATQKEKTEKLKEKGNGQKCENKVERKPWKL